MENYLILLCWWICFYVYRNDQLLKTSSHLLCEKTSAFNYRMVSVRKRKMARSSIRKNTRRIKDKQRNIKIHSNPIIEANWDHSLTLKQNYKRLGLASKLGHIAGGQEQKVVKWNETSGKKSETPSIQEIEQTQDPSNIPQGEARIIRDPHTQEVIKVIYGTMKCDNDELNNTQDKSVIEALQQQAIKNANVSRERHQSDRESEWLKNLYEKYGDDYEKMMWDKKLNIHQQSVGDLKKRINKWKKANGL